MRKPVRRKGESENQYIKRSCITLFTNGYNINEIAKKMNITNTEVFNALHDDIHYITKDEEKLINSLYSSGMSMKDIAEQFGVNRKTIGKKINGSTNAFDDFQNGEIIKDIDLDMIKKMYESGKSSNVIAKELDISEHRIRYRLTKMGLYVTKVTRVSKREKSKFNRLYANGLTITEIAKKCGRSRDVVSKYIER